MMPFILPRGHAGGRLAGELAGAAKRSPQSRSRRCDRQARESSVGSASAWGRDDRPQHCGGRAGTAIGRSRRTSSRARPTSGTPAARRRHCSESSSRGRIASSTIRSERGRRIGDLVVHQPVNPGILPVGRHAFEEDPHVPREAFPLPTRRSQPPLPPRSFRAWRRSRSEPPRGTGRTCRRSDSSRPRRSRGLAADLADGDVR